MTRAELAPSARAALLAGASLVVGKLGYAQASVARIAAAAGMAPGTFYLYFPNRQALFDELLLHAGGQMLAFVRFRTARASDFFQLEERGIAAFLEYLQAHPGFLRILNEAEAVAPAAWQRHYDDVARRFRRELCKASATGQIRILADAEMHTVVYLMMGARVSMCQLCQREGLSEPAEVTSVVMHYMHMIRSWLTLRSATTNRQTQVQSDGKD